MVFLLLFYFRQAHWTWPLAAYFPSYFRALFTGQKGATTARLTGGLTAWPNGHIWFAFCTPPGLVTYLACVLHTSRTYLSSLFPCTSLFGLCLSSRSAVFCTQQSLATQVHTSTNCQFIHLRDLYFYMHGPYVVSSQTSPINTVHPRRTRQFNPKITPRVASHAPSFPRDTTRPHRPAYTLEKPAWPL